MELEKLQTKQLKAVEEMGKLKAGDAVSDPNGELGFVDTIEFSEKKDEIVIHMLFGNEEKKLTWDYFKYYKYLRIGPKTDYTELFTQIKKDAEQALLDPSVFEYKDTPTDSTALISNSGPDRMNQTREYLEERSVYVEAVKRIVNQKATAIMDKVNELARHVSVMVKEIKRLEKVLGVFELYLGIEEKIVQIQEGPVSNDIPSVRQMVLFMDEEVAVIEGGGIDWTKIEEFDEWVTVNYKTLAPEEKCIVALRPSRQKRWRYNIWGELFKAVDKEDMRLYLLIRNGDNLYRIYTGLPRIDELFFPNHAEFEEVKERYRYSSEDEIKEKKLDMARNAMIIQGIADRTDILNPLDQRVDVMRSENINFIYDAEVSLTDGHTTYSEWRNKINSEIKVGTRIIISNYIKDSFRQYTDDHYDRFLRYYGERSANIPPPPKAGVYTVEEILSDNHYYKLVIRYNPEDERWIQSEWRYEKRKNRVSFCVSESDPFVLNYDLLTLNDIEYFLNSRYERKNYLRVFPALLELRKHRLKEIEWEKHFVDLVIARNNVSENEVWEAVDWWKSRVKWTRAISADDSKALRMITRKLGGVWSDEEIKNSFDK